jgi:hypothetical protein
MCPIACGSDRIVAPLRDAVGKTFIIPCAPVVRSRRW